MHRMVMAQLFTGQVKKFGWQFKLPFSPSHFLIWHPVQLSTMTIVHQ